MRFRGSLSRSFILCALILSALACAVGFYLARQDRSELWRGQVSNQLEQTRAAYQNRRNLTTLLNGVVQWRTLAEVTIDKDRLVIIAHAGELPHISELPPSDELLAAVGAPSSWRVASSLQAFAVPLRDETGRTTSLMYGETATTRAIEPVRGFVLIAALIALNGILLFWPRQPAAPSAETAATKRRGFSESPSVRTITLRSGTQEGGSETKESPTGTGT
jgi:hypothetical protein